jgi:hypothetical protein
MKRRLATALALAALAAGCAATDTPDPEAPAAPATEAPAEPEAAPVAEISEPDEPVAAKELPSTCEDDAGDICTPPKAFVERLCRSTHPDVALAMFRKTSPWTRAYVRRNMEAWYTEARSRPRELTFGEEVIIVHDRASNVTGVRVSGSGSYDVLRWDGSCVSMMSDEIAMRPPTAPEVARIPWRRLEPSIRNQLLEDTTVARRAEQRRESCKSDPYGTKCTRADQGLSRMIAHYLRQGGEIPDPIRLP